MAESQGVAKAGPGFAVAPRPENDAERVAAVRALGLLDTAPEERFDAVVRLAASFFNVPISYISLVDQERQWFKSKVGISEAETPREPAFCAFTILEDEAFLVPDARADARFANNPLVIGSPNIGAYAGVPLSDANRQRVGTLCLADHKAREFTEHDAEILWNLARLVEREMHLGDTIRQQEERLRVQAELIESQKERDRLITQLEAEKERSENFLLSLMPGEIASELREHGTVDPRYFHDVTVLFTDFVGFTAHTQKLAAEDLISLLNGYFSAFDSVVGAYGLEKLKTIGDAYMCVGGLPHETASHPVDAVLAAMHIQEMMRELLEDAGEVNMDIRIGIHTGPVVAGVIGMKRLAFDIWGETVNFASRMESSGMPGCINISESTYLRVKDFFVCEPRGKVHTKEKKDYEMYFVKGILPALGDHQGACVPPAFQRRYKTYFRRELESFPNLPGE